MSASKRFLRPAANKTTKEQFDLLSRDEQRNAIGYMADFGYGEYHIAAVTRLSVEQVRHILAERQERED